MKSARETEKELLDYWQVSKLKFLAHYAINQKNGIGFFRDIRKEDGSKCIFPDDTQVSIGIPPSLSFDIEKEYIIHAHIAPDDKREKRGTDYLLFLDTKSNPPRESNLNPQEYVGKIRNEYMSARGIAKESLIGSLKRLSSETNKKPETFIYELLQNADDNPDRTRIKVNVRFIITENNLILIHNGQPFNQKNVYGICSVAAGDKEVDINKTGYKGIGFKSIFKHSNYVWIHSGGFSFRFDEEYHTRGGNVTFWQVIPVWTDINEISEDKNKPEITNAPVAIVIKPKDGKKRLIEFEQIFNRVFKDEKVLIFLRNVDSISFSGPESNFVSNKSPQKWEKSELLSIEVPKEIQESLNNVIDKSLDDRVPEKYKDIATTQICFATRIDSGKIALVKDAKLYAYLPTDLNFGFPFLMNGDFIPDGSRDKLFWDIQWNCFLFEESGTQFVNWIQSLYNKYKQPGIFKLLPDLEQLIKDELDLDKKNFLKLFEKGFINGLQNVEFIPDNDGNLRKIEDVIIDETGISKLLKERFSDVAEITEHLVQDEILLDGQIIKLIKKYGNVFDKKQLVFLTNVDAFKEWLKTPINNSKFLRLLHKKEWFGSFLDEYIYLNQNSELCAGDQIYLTVNNDISLIDWLDISYLHPAIYNEPGDLSLPILPYTPVKFIEKEIILNKVNVDGKLSEKANNLAFYRYLFKHIDVLSKKDFFGDDKLNYFKVWSIDDCTIDSTIEKNVYMYNPAIADLLIKKVFPEDQFYIISNEYCLDPSEMSEWDKFWLRFGVKQFDEVTVFDFLNTEVLNKLSKLEKHFDNYDAFDEDDSPSETFIMKQDANVQLWLFIADSMKNLSPVNMESLTKGLGDLVVFTEEHCTTKALRDCYLSSEYTNNDTLEILAEQFEDINISFVSGIYLENKTLTSKQWTKLFSEEGGAQTDEKQFAMYLSDKLNQISDDNIIAITQFLFKNRDIFKDDTTKLKELKILLEDGDIVDPEDAYLGDHYSKNNLFGTILPQIAFPNQVSHDYSDKQLAEWSTFFRKLGVKSVLTEDEIIEWKIAYLINNQEIINTENTVRIVQDLARLHSEEKLTEAQIEELRQLKLLLKGTDNEFLSAEECHFAGEYKPKINLEELIPEDIRPGIFVSDIYLKKSSDDKLVASFLRKIISKPFELKDEAKIKWTNVPRDYTLSLKSMYPSINKSVENFNVFEQWINLKDIEFLIYHDVAFKFWENISDKNGYLRKYLESGRMMKRNLCQYCSSNYYSSNTGKYNRTFSNQNVFNYVDFYIETNPVIPVMSGVCRVPKQVYSYRLKGMIDDKSLICAFDLSDIIIEENGETLESYIGIRKKLSLELCLKRINKIRNFKKLEKEGIWERQKEIFKNKKLEIADSDTIEINNFIQYGVLPNQIGEWKNLSDLYFICDDFELGIGNSQWLIDDNLKDIAGEFELNKLTEEDFKPNYKSQKTDPAFENNLGKHLKFIAFAEDQLNWKTKEKEFLLLYEQYVFIQTSRISFSFNEVNPPIENTEKNFYRDGSTIYYVGLWNGPRAVEIFHFLHNLFNLSRVSVKLLQDLLLNSESEIVDFFLEKNLNVPDGWKSDITHEIQNDKSGKKVEFSPLHADVNAKTKNQETGRPLSGIQETRLPENADTFILSEKEIQDLVQIFGRKLKPEEISNQLILSLYRSLKVYESMGYDVSWSRDNMQTCIKKRMLTNVLDHNSVSLRVLTRSAKRGAFYMTKTAWDSLLDNDAELCLITGNGPSDYKIFKTQDELSQFNSDSWVLRLDGEDKQLCLNSLISDYNAINADLQIIIRLQSDKVYDSIFKSIYDKEIRNREKEPGADDKNFNDY